MKFLKTIFEFPPLVKILIVLLVLGTGWFTFRSIKTSSTQTARYQTAVVEKGTLTVVVNASGQVTSQNSAAVDTQASGVVTKVFVENGQKVISGDKIAELDLDLVGKQRSSQAQASYLASKNNLETAKINYYALQSDLLTNWKEFMDISQSSLYENSDKTPNTAKENIIIATDNTSSPISKAGSLNVLGAVNIAAIIIASTGVTIIVIKMKPNFIPHSTP